MVDSKVTRSIRADAETIDRFKILAEQFSNQGECLESLIRTYEIDNAKKIESEMKPDIRSFESHINALYGLYISSVEKIGDLKKANNKFSEQIKELMKRIAVYESVANGEETEVEESEEDLKRFKNIGELCARNRDLTAEVDKYKSENTELSEKINKLTQENGELSAKISELKADLLIKSKQNEIELIKAVNEKEAHYLKKMAELMETKDKLANELYELKKNI